MALVHPLSSESTNTGLDLFSLPPTQTSLESGQFIEHFPVSALNHGSPIEFVVRGSGEEYIDLHNTFLQIKAKVTDPQGGDLSIDDNTAPVNYWLHSLFSQVDISLNDTLITTSQNTYSYRAYIEATLNYGRDAKKGHLSAAMYYRDSANHFNAITTADNKGIVARRGLIRSSKTVDMYGRLHTDITAQDRYLLNGVDVKIKLTPSKHTFHLMSEGGALAQILHASLHVRKVKPNPAVALAHNKALEQNTAKYPLTRVVTKVFSVPRGQMSCVEDNLFLSQLPKRIVIGLVKSAAFLGAYKENPFYFGTHHLNYLAVSIDGKNVPGKPLTPNFDTDLCARAFYHQALAGISHQNKDQGSYLEYKDFNLGYGLFVFDLSPSYLDGGQVELLRSGSLRLEFKFGTALVEPLHVVVLGELDGLLEIDKSRQILTDFAL